MSAKMFRSIHSIAHLLHGALAGFMFSESWILSVFLYVQFVLYEYVEESKLKDEMYCELKEWSTGFVIGLLLYFVLKKLFFY